MKDNIDIKGIASKISNIREMVNLYIEGEIKEQGLEGILPAHGGILVFLFKQKEPVPIKDLVGSAGRVKSTVTGMVNTLEKYGYLRKINSAIDARVVLVELTAKGKALQKPFLDISEKLLEKIYAGFTLGDKEKLNSLLNMVKSNFDKVD